METEFLIVGSGIAGLRAAIALAPAGRTLILTKADPAESNTGYAQGGIAAALGPDDSPALHAADTVRAGAGLCDETVVNVLVEDGLRYVRELITWGAAFDRDASGHLALGLEAAHRRRRILHSGDSTGREIGRTLWRRAVALRSVEIVNHAFVTELLVEEGAVCGARFFDSGGSSLVVRARATLLATGGAGQVFCETTNPGVATGDGVALAAHAGARVADLEFVQFHPTALHRSGAPRFLISEAVRGEGARLVNASGEPFMARYHADGDLAPRDVVARSIVREAERQGGVVFLSLAHLDAAFVRSRFPTIAEMCRRVGLDLTTDLIPVGPAAHYFMGGVDTEEWGRTSIPGLFAAGETACTGVHGANRLASNSLLEGLVFGARAGVAMQGPAREAVARSDRKPAEGLRLDRGGDREKPQRAANLSRPSPLDMAAVRDLMWRSVGLFRTGDGLREALACLDSAVEIEHRRAARAGDESPADWQRRNLLTVARLVARAALRREESRGAHCRVDFPTRNDSRWKFHAVDVQSVQ